MNIKSERIEKMLDKLTQISDFDRFGKPDSCAVLIQNKAPETRVSPQELNLNFPCAFSPLDTQEEAEDISNLENAQPAQPAAIAPRRAF